MEKELKLMTKGHRKCTFCGEFKLKHKEDEYESLWECINCEAVFKEV